MKTLVLILLAISSYGQISVRLDMQISRYNDQTYYHAPTLERTRITWLGADLLIQTETDSLYLKFNKEVHFKETSGIYYLLNGEDYWINYSEGKQGLIIFIVPINETSNYTFILRYGSDCLRPKQEEDREGDY